LGIGLCDDLNDEVTFARLKKAIREIEEKEPGSIEKQLSLLLEHYIRLSRYALNSEAL
jgi:hypothetical protein